MSKKPVDAPRDPWALVEGECPSKLARAAHAGRLHVVVRDVVSCIPWRVLLVGERATDAWIEASAHRLHASAGEARAVIGGDDSRCVCRAPDAAAGPCAWCGAIVRVYQRTAFALEVPGAREAEYPEPERMRFVMSDALAIDAQAAKTAAEVAAYYERVLRPVSRLAALAHRPGMSRRAA